MFSRYSLLRCPESKKVFFLNVSVAYLPIVCAMFYNSLESYKAKCFWFSCLCFRVRKRCQRNIVNSKNVLSLSTSRNRIIIFKFFIEIFKAFLNHVQIPNFIKIVKQYLQVFSLYVAKWLSLYVFHCFKILYNTVQIHLNN